MSVGLILQESGQKNQFGALRVKLIDFTVHVVVSIFLDPSYHAFSISPPSRPQCNGKMCVLLCCWGERVSTSVRQAGQWAANCCVTCCRAVHVHVTEVSTALGHVGE